MSQQIVQVDSFTHTPFAGNPAGVCVMDDAADESWMADVAREMNLSETAFVYPVADGFHLRWFTPVVEVEMCGHATLAAAHVLYEDGHIAPDRQARFATMSGLLTAARQDDLIELNFPAVPLDEVPAPPSLTDALGVSALGAARGQFDYLVEVASEEEVRSVQPDFGALSRQDARGFIVTARATSGEYDFVSRFFAPAMGIDEDPVTGAAHCALGPYWAARLGKTEFTAYQASARGGVVRVRVAGERVVLGGQAVTVMRGELV